MEIFSFIGTITSKTEQRCYILTGYLLTNASASHFSFI